jgi:hypothetical protein
MERQSITKKKQFWDDAKLALTQVLTPPPPGYICPICLDLFDDISKLSLEHVPPKSIGGQRICLTCEPCNKTAGGSIDAAVHKERQSKQFLALEGFSRWAQLRAADLAVNVAVNRQEGSLNIVVLPNHNDPAVIKAAQSKLWTERSFQLADSISYHRILSDVGYLKSAYLAAFAKFGYRYILQPSLNTVREQIIRPQASVLANFRVYLHAHAPEQPQLLVVHDPVACLVVQMGDTAILLPWLSHDTTALYSVFGEAKRQASSMSLMCYGPIAWPRGMELSLDKIAQTNQDS